MKFEGRKNSVVMFLTVAISVALALSLMHVTPFAEAQPPAIVGLICGQTVAGQGNVVIDDGVNPLYPVPVDCIVEVRNTADMSQVITWFRIGDGTEGPPGVFLPGEFDVSVSIPSGMEITLRAYDSAESGSATLWGDSAPISIVNSGAYYIDGWPLGNTQVPNTYSSQYASGYLNLTTNGLPIINSYDLRDASTDQSFLNRQLDVGREYYFVVNATDLSGVDEISVVNIKAWYDFGEYGTETSYDFPDHVPNTRFALQYNWFTQAYTLMSTHTGYDPEITLGSLYKWVYSGYTPTPDTFELHFYFTLGEQIRHAPGDGLFEHPPTGEFNGIYPSAYNDLRSWNFEITVESNDGVVPAKANDEFGVYQFTSISAGDLEGEGLPGQVVAFPELLINYSSNDRYNLGVYVNNTLVKIWPDTNTTPDFTIGVTNISVSGGWLPKTTFTGTGSSETLFFYPQRPAPSYGTYQEVPVYFWVNIPLNVLGGKYQGDVVYMIEQVPL